jgi:hypothetical protein
MFFTSFLFSKTNLLWQRGIEVNMNPSSVRHLKPSKEFKSLLEEAVAEATVWASHICGKPLCVSTIRGSTYFHIVIRAPESTVDV